MSLVVSRSASADECRALGFNKNVVQCADCAVVSRVMNDEELHSDCLACCDTKEEEQYQLAVLEIDPRFAARIPNMMDIIKIADQLNVVVRHTPGARPVLLMYKERTDDVPLEEINVFSWSVDTFKEYIAEHVVRG